MRDLSSLTRDQDCVPCSGSTESWPPENQGCLAMGFLLGKGFSLIFHATTETQLSDCSPLLITLPLWSA